MNTLSLVRIDFTAEVTKDVLLPGYLGNTLRGGLGKALVRLFCSTNDPRCESCQQRESCVYPNVFKTPEHFKGYPTAPNPYIIKIPKTAQRSFSPGGSLDFSIVLFGSAASYSEQVITAVKAMLGHEGDWKLGGLRLVQAVDGYFGDTLFADDKLIKLPEPRIWSDEGRDRIPAHSSIGITFLTPVQIHEDKALVNHPNFDQFINSLFLRIASIIDLYGDGDFVLPYMMVARKPRIEADFALTKVSVKQQDMSADGILGRLVYTGDLTRYMPYIDLGTQLHVGKLNTSGFGEYEFERLG